jgi:hypothetical protein
MKMRLLLLITSLTIALKVTATPSDDDTNAVVGVSVETNGIRLTAYATNSIFVSGSPIMIETTVKNISTNNIEIVTSAIGTLHRHIVRVSQQGREINMIERDKLGDSPVNLKASGSIPPGYKFAEPLPISKYFNMTNFGDYEITISRYMGAGTITTPPLKITVTNN